jgi:hypothetical protein
VALQAGRPVHALAAVCPANPALCRSRTERETRQQEQRGQRDGAQMESDGANSKLRNWRSLRQMVPLDLRSIVAESPAGTHGQRASIWLSSSR